MNTLRIKMEAIGGVKGDDYDAAVFNNGELGVKRRPSEDSDAVYGISKEIYNFQSAP